MNNKPAYPQIGVASTCRSYEEYERMFGLDEDRLLGEKVLDVAGGASSFTTTLCARGIDAYAADPFYEGDKEEIVAAAGNQIDTSSAKLAAMAHIYDWSYYESSQQHRRLREASLCTFARHFRSGRSAERYVAAGLPNLPFLDDTFALAVCSHFLLLYAGQFGEDFHAAALHELLRVTKPGGEVRVYPLVTLSWDPVPYLDRLLDGIHIEAEVQFVSCNLPFVPTKSKTLILKKQSRATTQTVFNVRVTN